MIYGNGDYQYELVDNWAKLPDDMALLDVCSIGIDSEDRIYLINRGTHPVMVFDKEGNLLKFWGDGLFTHIHGGRVGPDNSVYCTDADGHTVSKHTNDGKLVFQLGTKNVPSDTGFIMQGDLDSALNVIKKSGPPFNYPTNTFITKAGDIFVSDGYGNARIHRFSPDGKLMYSWGEPGRGPGEFRVPHSLWVDKNDQVWVADRQNHRIQIFDIKGNYIDQWIGFKRPCDMYIDDEGTVYVAELDRRISILDKDGKLLSYFSCQEEDKEKALLLGPHGITVDSDGDIYVGEVAKTMGKIDRRGRVVRKFKRIRK